MRLIILCCLFLCSLPAYAKEIAGVMVQETLQTEDGSTLHLNGAGIRSKFFFDIYIAELYLEHPAGQVREVIEDTGKKRVVMHFLYKKVEKEKLIEGWNEGFAGNCTAEQMAKLQERIDQFNSMFVDVTKGDIVELDFLPDEGTAVTIAGQKKGVIAGKDFNDGLLKIWLGDKPVNKGLKEKLLSYN
jgi:Chalcone isomerase-like